MLSRACTDAFPRGFSWARAFGAACRRYVHSYVYLFHTPQTGFWLGATPEILLAGGKGDYRTVALAGTQFLKEGKLAGPWSEKNIREQAFVTEYIGGCLRERDIRFTVEGPYTATAGELAHLKTEYPFPSFFGRSLRRLVAGFASYACRMRVAQRRGFSLHPVA